MGTPLSSGASDDAAFRTRLGEAARLAAPSVFAANAERGDSMPSAELAISPPDFNAEKSGSPAQPNSRVIILPAGSRMPVSTDAGVSLGLASLESPRLADPKTPPTNPPSPPKSPPVVAADPTSS